MEISSKTLPTYFVIVLAIYAAIFITVLSYTAPVLGMVEFAPFLLLLLLPAILFGVYIYKFPKLWLRIIIMVLAIIAIVFSFLLLIPIM